MSDSIRNLVNRFDGSNANEWFDQMVAYLQLKGLWSIVNGDYPKPAEAASNVKPEEKAVIDKEIREWKIDDGKARGALILCVTPSIANQAKDKATSKEVWDALKKKYSKVGVSTIYADFKAAVNFKVTGNGDPRPEIAELQKHFDRLETNGIELPDFVRGMLLLGAAPQKWDNTLSLILTASDKPTDVTFEKVSQGLIAEYERNNNPAALNKMTNIKRKRYDPKFKQQQQPGQSSSSNAPNGQQGQKKKHRGKRAGKNNKGQSSHNHAHNHSVSHIASATIAAPVISPPLPTTTTVASSSLDPGPYDKA